ncbi:MAG: TonB-dependent receptor [Bacteroidetes bacterium]|nr:TonB-dependent receptor [Bacteroidota bacterium]
MGTLSIFGLGGFSSIGQEERESEESERVVERSDFGAQLGVIGINHTLPLNQNSYLKLTFSASNNGSDYESERIDESDVFNFDGKGKWEKSSIRSALMFSSKINAKNRLMTGIKYTRHFYDMKETYYNDEYDRIETVIDMQKQAGDLQTYFTWKYRMNDDITWVGGLHSMYFSLNKNLLLEPRLAMRWQISPNQAVNAGFGLHSKTESIVTYFTHVYAPDGSYSTPNTQLGLSKARHYVLGYEYRISANLNSKLDFYYQDLYNIPVENLDTSSFTILNSDEGYISKSLVSSGKGENYGIEYTLERYFVNNFYFLVTASLYESKYKALENKYRNTKYNGNYAVNFLTGKEFKIGKGTRANALGVNIKVFFTGGRRYIPVDLEASQAKGETVYDYSRAWDNKLDDVKQVNFSLTYRINRPKASHEIILDVINITNEKARNWEYYNEYTGKLDYYRQLNMIPNIMYRIHF